MSRAGDAIAGVGPGVIGRLGRLRLGRIPAPYLA